MNNKRKMSLATRKFAASAVLAGFGTIVMAAFPYDVVIYPTALYTMGLIIIVLLTGKNKKGHWEDVPPLPSDMFTLEERKKMGRTTWTKQWKSD